MMAKFFVGQRVRLVRACKPSNSGLTGRIREIHPEVVGEGGVAINCRCDWDDGTSDAWGHWGTHTSRLEPILPSGHRAGTESFQELMDRLNTEKVERVEEVGA